MLKLEQTARPDYGQQEPRSSSVPPAAWSASDDVAVLCESATHLGRPFTLMPWQDWLLARILGVRDDGRWAARDAAFLVSRQNGKGGVLHALALGGLFLFDEVREILHSAHEVKTAKKAYRELRDIIERTPHLYAQVERRGSRVVGFRQSNEDTSITLQDGSVIRFMARATNTARGFSPQWLIIDEAQICSEESREALFYATRAQSNPLRIWCGTVPHSGADTGDVFESLRDRGRAGGDPHLLWAEWSVDPSASLEELRGDDEAAATANPALGYLLDWETLDSERSAARSDRAWLGFCREALSWWPEDGDGLPWELMSEAAWIAAGVPAARMGMADPVTFALEVSPDLDSAWIAASGSTGEGRDMVELIQVFDNGTEGIVERLAELMARHGARGVVIDERSTAAVFVSSLEQAGVPVLVPSTADAVEASLAFTVGVTEGGVCWPSGIELEPVLTRAAGVAVRRRARDAWLIDRHSDRDALPLIAAALALWGHRRPVVVQAEPDFLVL